MMISPASCARFIGQNPWLVTASKWKWRRL